MDLKSTLCELLLILVTASTIHAKCENKIDPEYANFRFVKCTYKRVYYEYKLECEEPDVQISCEQTNLEEMHKAIENAENKVRLYVKDSTLTSDDKISGWNNVTELLLENVKFTNLEEKIFKGFEDLKILGITKSEIAHIPANTFRSLENLDKLNISGNTIRGMDKDAFIGLKNVTYFSLRENQIKILPAGIFNNLTKAIEIDLSHNQLTKIETEFPNHLTQISINHNKLKDLNFSLILSSHVTLDLSNNNIENLVNFNKSEAIVLNLANNQIKILPPIGPSLVELDISSNILTRIDPFAKSNLRTLIAENNNIQTISVDAFAGAENLRKLSLASNYLGVLTHGCFNHLDSLVSLNLSHNHIFNFTFGLMDPLSNLEDLDISYNNHDIDLHTILNLNKLEKLNLAGNNVEKFDPKIIVEHFTNLKRLSIDDTTWNCKDLSQAVAVLEKKIVRFVIEQGTTKNESNVRGIKCSDDPTSKLTTIDLDQQQLHPKTMDELASSFLHVQQNNKILLSEIFHEIRKFKEDNFKFHLPVSVTVSEISDYLKQIEKTMKHHGLLLKETAPSSTVSTFVVFITIILCLILALLAYNVFYSKVRSRCSGDQINLV